MPKGNRRQESPISQRRTCANSSKLNNVQLDKLTKQMQIYKEDAAELEEEISHLQTETNDCVMQVEESFKQLATQFSKLAITQNDDKQISKRMLCFNAINKYPLSDEKSSELRSYANQIKDMIIASHIPEDPFNIYDLMSKFQAEIYENEKFILKYNKTNKQLERRISANCAKICKDCNELLIPANDTCSKHLGSIKTYSENDDEIAVYKDRCENCDCDIYYNCCLKCAKCYPECHTSPHRF